ncbi:hypothetical protein F4703DRAFT_1798116 [Phycomyces blakesleeanus]
MSWSSTGLMFLRYTQGIDLYGNYVTCNFQNDKKRMYFVDGNTYDATYVETLSATHNSFSERMFTTTSHLGIFGNNYIRHKKFIEANFDRIALGVSKLKTNYVWSIADTSEQRYLYRLNIKSTVDHNRFSRTGVYILEMASR